MGCTVLGFHLAADLLTASQLRSEGIPLVIFDLLNLIVYPNLYRRSSAHMAKAVISDLSFTGGAGDAVGTLLDVTPGDHTSNRSRSADFDHGPSKPP
jgi:hypothetical protein